MTTKFHAPHPWQEISKYADKGKGYVAVPFIGKNAYQLLPLKEGSVLVTRFSEQAVRAGQVSPAEILKYIRYGVQVFSYDSLHAKVYVFSRRAFVGSANASKSSQTLTEAVIECNESNIIHAAKDFVLGLTGDLVTPKQARKLVALYPKDGERQFGYAPGSGRKPPEPRSRVWILPVSIEDWPLGAKQTDRIASVEAQKKIADHSRFKLKKAHWDNLPKHVEGDWVVYRWSKGRGSDFECPSRVIEIRPVPNGEGYLIYSEQPKFQRDISSTTIRKVFGAESKLFFGTRDRLVRQKQLANDLMQLWSSFRPK